MWGCLVRGYNNIIVYRIHTIHYTMALSLLLLSYPPIILLHPELNTAFHCCQLSPWRRPLTPDLTLQGASPANYGFKKVAADFWGKCGLFFRTLRVGALFTAWRHGQRRQPKTVILVGCAVSGPQASLHRSRPMIHYGKYIFEQFRAIF